MIALRERFQHVTDVRWNFWTLGMDIAFFTFGLSVTSAYTILPLYVHHLTNANWPVALITALRSLGLFAPTLFVAARVERLWRVKPNLLVMTQFERIPLLIMAIATVFLAYHYNVLLLVIFFIMITLQAAGSGLSSSSWLDMISRAIPTTMRGRFLGGWSGVGALFGIGGGALAAAFLRIFLWPWNFAACFTVTFIAFVISFFLLAMGREPVRTEVHAPLPTGGSPWQRFHVWSANVIIIVQQDRRFRRYIVANAIAGTATIANGLLALVAIRQAHFTPEMVGIQTTVLLVAVAIGNFLWGFIGDHFSHRLVLVLSAAVGTLAMVLALFGVNVWTITGAFFCFGLSDSGLVLGRMNFIIEIGPPARLPMYIGLAALLGAPFVTISPLIGGFIADIWGYTPLLLLAIGLGIASIATFALYVPKSAPTPLPII